MQNDDTDIFSVARKIEEKAYEFMTMSKVPQFLNPDIEQTFSLK